MKKEVLQIETFPNPFPERDYTIDMEFMPQNRATGLRHPVYQLYSGEIVHRIEVIKALSGVIPE